MNSTQHDHYHERIEPILHTAFLRWLATEGRRLSGILNESAQERAIRGSLHKLADEQADLFMDLVNGRADRVARYRPDEEAIRALLAKGHDLPADLRTDQDMLGLRAAGDELVIELDIVIDTQRFGDPGACDIHEAVGDALGTINGLACRTVRAWTDFRIINESGPGGGWPNVDVTFRNRELAVAWLMAYCHGDVDDVEYLLSLARRKDA